MTDHPSPLITAIRRRPGMYVGPLKQQVVYEVVRLACATALDTVPPTACQALTLTIRPDHGFHLQSVGHYEEGAALQTEHILTQRLTAPLSTSWSPPLYLAVLNALAHDFHFTCVTRGHAFSQHFTTGVPRTDVIHRATGYPAGRHLTFVPDRSIFQEWDGFDAAPLMGHIRMLAALTPGLQGYMRDQRTGMEMHVIYPHGFHDYLHDLMAPMSFETRMFETYSCQWQNGDIRVEAVLQWNSAHHAHCWSFVNGRATVDGGSHEHGMYEGIAVALDQVARTHQLFDATIPQVTMQQIVSTFAIVLHITDPHPQYMGAAKREIADPRLSHMVQEMVRTQLPPQLQHHLEIVGEWARDYMIEIQRGNEQDV